MRPKLTFPIGSPVGKRLLSHVSPLGRLQIYIVTFDSSYRPLYVVPFRTQNRQRLARNKNFPKVGSRLVASAIGDVDGKHSIRRQSSIASDSQRESPKRPSPVGGLIRRQVRALLRAAYGLRLAADCCRPTRVSRGWRTHCMCAALRCRSDATDRRRRLCSCAPCRRKGVLPDGRRGASKY